MVLICYYWLVGVFRFRWGIYDDDSVALCVSGIKCTGRQPARRRIGISSGSPAAWQQLGGCHLASQGVRQGWLWLCGCGLWRVAQCKAPKDPAGGQK